MIVGCMSMVLVAEDTRTEDEDRGERRRRPSPTRIMIRMLGENDAPAKMAADDDLTDENRPGKMAAYRPMTFRPRQVG